MALLPPSFLDCVVAIGTRREDAPVNEEALISEPVSWMASGFLYGYFMNKIDETSNNYRVYLVSNRHVFKGLDSAWLRFNPQADEPARQFRVRLRKKEGEPIWLASPEEEVDVAVLAIDALSLRNMNIQFDIFRQEDSTDIQALIELGTSEGDSIFALGFPMGLVGGERSHVIVRGGCIARIRDMLGGRNRTFLVDTTVFPGNSGGPVVLRPELASIEGTKSTMRAHLIGVVSSYVPYRDVALSAQTNRPRVIFEENSGLTEVHPVDCINEAIRLHLDSLGDDANGDAQSQPIDGQSRLPDDGASIETAVSIPSLEFI
jgi:hypothetical protein